MLEIFEENHELDETPRAVLVGLDTGTDHSFLHSMEELRALSEACGMEIVESFIQSLPNPNPATFIGSGKLNEIASFCADNDISYCVFEDTLSPAQLKNINKSIKCKTYDRTGLILEIFRRRAKSRESRLQVEEAQLQYMMPRLIGFWEAQGRQGGGSGSMSNKGVGETQLELDRRLIQKRISELKSELKNIAHDREIQRKHRNKGTLPLVSLVGYTNSGKSTIMNRLIRMSEDSADTKEVFEKDMLFATLDTYVRRINVPNERPFLLSDTVGFINKLPHQLVNAFHSTLEEAKYADLILEVIDGHDEHHLEQMAVTAETLKDLGCGDIPRIQVFNKADLYMTPMSFPKVDGNRIYLSAGTECGLNELISVIISTIYANEKETSFLIPFTNGSIVNDLNEHTQVIDTQYLPEGVLIKAVCSESIIGKYQSYEYRQDS